MNASELYLEFWKRKTVEEHKMYDTLCMKQYITKKEFEWLNRIDSEFSKFRDINGN